MHYLNKEEQTAMHFLGWYYRLKNELGDKYGIPIDNIQKFARVINEIDGLGHDANFILSEFWKVGSLRIEEQVLNTEISLLNHTKTIIESTLAFEESQISECRQTMETYAQLQNCNFGLNRLRQIKDTIVEISIAENKSVKEVSDMFFEDIQRYYYDKIRFEQRIAERKKELAQSNNVLIQAKNILNLYPLVMPALTNLVQKGVSEDDIADTLQIINRIASNSVNLNDSSCSCSSSNNNKAINNDDGDEKEQVKQKGDGDHVIKKQCLKTNWKSFVGKSKIMKI